ncbi:MAG: hypothetical protein ACRDTE_27120 [Pseudonocardiaceae bacterium]
MPNSDSNLEARIASLERQVAQLQEQTTLPSFDAGAARLLTATSLDMSTIRDELRVHTRGFSVLQRTQMEQDGAIASLDQKVTEGFATLTTRIAQITALLTEKSGSNLH